jgi:O-antigen/teichoic acid export membrane protein
MIALAYAACVYSDLLRTLKPPPLRFDIEGIGAYLRKLMPFVVLALATRTPLVLDRYLLEVFADREQLGVYGYYAAFGNGVQAMFDAIVVSKLIPQLLSCAISEKWGHVSCLVRRYVTLSLIFWSASVTIVYLAIPFFNQFTAKAALDNSGALFLAIVSGQMIFSLSVVIQYGLYSMRCDRELGKGAVIYLVLTLILFLILIPPFGSFGAAFALDLSAAALLSLRSWQLFSCGTSSRTAKSVGRSVPDKPANRPVSM